MKAVLSSLTFIKLKLKNHGDILESLAKAVGNQGYHHFMGTREIKIPFNTLTALQNFEESAQENDSLKEELVIQPLIAECHLAITSLLIFVFGIFSSTFYTELVEKTPQLQQGKP